MCDVQGAKAPAAKPDDPSYICKTDIVRENQLLLSNSHKLCNNVIFKIKDLNWHVFV